MSKETAVADLLSAAIITEIKEGREELFVGLNKDSDQVKMLEDFFDRGVANALNAVEKHLSLSGTVKLPYDEEVVYASVTGLADTYFNAVNT